MTMQELSTIKSIDIRNIWPHEANDFTPWLAEHITELGDALGLELESLGTEAPVGSFRLDILARDRDGDRPVAIENQLGETDHAHLGQLLTYTAGYDANVVVWIAGKFKDEHRAALDLLNRRTDDDSEFFGVVVEVWQIDNSRPAPHFRVVSAPNEWINQNKPTGDSMGSELSQRYRQFFQGLADNLGEGPDVPHPHKVHGKSYLGFGTGFKGFSYSAAFSYGGVARVELYFSGSDRDKNKERFDELELSREAIESEIGGKFAWERLDDKMACRISVVRSGSIKDDQNKLDEIRDWMIEKLPVVKKTFGPRLADLVG
jgi:hypothetical protein